jgi:crossover junction endonuclease EME1
MEGGQFKSASTPEEIFLKMLQQVHRVTPQIAEAITGKYKSVDSIVKAFRADGPLILADLVVFSHVRDGCANFCSLL